MHYLLTFETQVFPTEKEPENPYNLNLGYSAGLWLTPLLQEQGAKVGNIEAEDWGWYMDIQYEGQSYMAGFTIHVAEDEDLADEVLIQIHKKRSLWQRLRGTNQLDASDALLVFIQTQIKTLPLHSELSISKV